MSPEYRGASSSAFADSSRLVDITAVPVEVPVPGGPHRTARGVRTHCVLVAVEIRTHSGVAGRAVAFTPKPASVELAAALESVGSRLAAETGAELPALLERLTGPVARTARAVVDMAIWDARSTAAGEPLYSLLGGDNRGVPVYGVVGLEGIDRTVADAEALASAGMGGVKLKLGHPDLSTDLRVVEAVRRAIGPDMALMVDYNQSLTVEEAQERGRALDGLGLTWIEEPIRWDDFLGQRRLAAQLRTPIQTGENLVTGADVRAALDIVGSRILMLDVQTIGGVTPWRRTARLLAARRVPVSTHLWSGLSAHLLAGADHPGWLEWSDWWRPFLARSVTVRDGLAYASEWPGNGVRWDDADLARYRL